MRQPVVISVVRDFKMYERCVVPSSECSGCERVAIDNRELNERIPVLYNRFLDAFDYSHPAWLVFCHEDFEWKDCLSEQLDNLPADAIYGPMGTRYRVEWLVNVHLDFCGRIRQSNKDGSDLHDFGCPVGVGTEVATLDCACLIVHSDLVSRFHLRFDEELSFDLYAEDFCIAARERYGLVCRILPLECQHWSAGIIGERYYRQLDYLSEKWPHVAYPSTCSFTVGGRMGLAWVNGLIKTSGIKTRMKALCRRKMV